MGYFLNDELLAIVETKINNRHVNLISPAFITPGRYRSKVYCEKTHATQLENIQDQDIQMGSEFSLPMTDNINRHLFQLIIFACNNLRETLQSSVNPNQRKESYSSIGVKSNDYTRMTHSFDENSIHLLTRGLIKNIDQQEIDWGLVYYFSKNEKSQEQGIHINLIHPQYCCTFFIPVKCTKGIFTTLRIKARNIKLINTHYHYSVPFKDSAIRINSYELLQQPKEIYTLKKSLVEMKFMVKRFLRSWRFLVAP